MTHILIPPLKSTFKTSAVWEFQIEWYDYNLVFLRKQGVTGQQEYFGRKVTIRNPLFSTDDGYIPIVAELPAGTVLEFNEYVKNSNLIKIKILDCPIAKFKKSVIMISNDQINVLEVERVS